jgi:hypothetical protein
MIPDVISSTPPDLLPTASTQQLSSALACLMGWPVGQGLPHGLINFCHACQTEFLYPKMPAPVITNAPKFIISSYKT